MRCGNSLASVYYNVIWGGRVPVLAEPLLRGVTWTSSGGAGNDVASTSRYLGTENITVPAFDHPVTASIVRSDITQAGALGDPYGSGIRTIWWVYGVGPAKIQFEHAGGAGAPVTTAVLQATNQTPKAPPPDVDYFPLKKGLKARYSWTNTKYMKKPSVQDFTVDQVVNASARVVREERQGADQGRGRVRLHAAQRGRDEHLGNDAGGDPPEVQVPAARAELGAEDEAAALLHAVRPHELRLQPALPGLSAAVQQLERKHLWPGLPDLRRHGSRRDPRHPDGEGARGHVPGPRRAGRR